MARMDMWDSRVDVNAGITQYQCDVLQMFHARFYKDFIPLTLVLPRKHFVVSGCNLVQRTQACVV
jgi:hypothetical protein